jgi:hypothetical protein
VSAFWREDMQYLASVNYDDKVNALKTLWFRTRIGRPAGVELGKLLEYEFCRLCTGEDARAYIDRSDSCTYL